MVHLTFYLIYVLALQLTYDTVFRLSFYLTCILTFFLAVYPSGILSEIDGILSDMFLSVYLGSLFDICPDVLYDVSSWHSINICSGILSGIYLEEILSDFLSNTCSGPSVPRSSLIIGFGLMDVQIELELVTGSRSVCVQTELDFRLSFWHKTTYYFTCAVPLVPTTVISWHKEQHGGGRREGRTEGRQKESKKLGRGCS